MKTSAGPGRQPVAFDDAVDVIRRMAASGNPTPEDVARVLGDRGDGERARVLQPYAFRSGHEIGSGDSAADAHRDEDFGRSPAGTKGGVPPAHAVRDVDELPSLRSIGWMIVIGEAAIALVLIMLFAPWVLHDPARLLGSLKQASWPSATEAVSSLRSVVAELRAMGRGETASAARNVTTTASVQSPIVAPALPGLAGEPFGPPAPEQMLVPLPPRGDEGVDGILFRPAYASEGRSPLAPVEQHAQMTAPDPTQVREPEPVTPPAHDPVRQVIDMVQVPEVPPLPIELTLGAPSGPDERPAAEAVTPHRLPETAAIAKAVLAAVDPPKPDPEVTGATTVEPLPRALTSPRESELVPALPEFTTLVLGSGLSNLTAERATELAETLAEERKQALVWERERADQLASELAQIREEIGALRTQALQNQVSMHALPLTSLASPGRSRIWTDEVGAIPEATFAAPARPTVKELPALVPAQTRASGTTADVPVERAPAGPPPASLSSDSRKRLIDRANALIAARDISGARLVLERAAADGSATALYLLAQTYDPRALSTWAVVGLRGDRARADSLYAKARAAAGEGKPLQGYLAGK